MAEVSNKPWGAISESDYESAEAFCSACLIDLNPAGKPKTKALCKLPVKEPGGMMNANGMRAAAAALAGARGGVDAPTDVKRAAARKLMGMMRSADLEPPESMRVNLSLMPEGVGELPSAHQAWAVESCSDAGRVSARFCRGGQ